MGDQDVKDSPDQQQLRAFMRSILDDVQALERMCNEGMIESGVRRIGAEQELFLVDRSWSPAPVAVEILEKLDEPSVVTELALFNLEINLSSRELSGSCLRQMEDELLAALRRVREVAQALGADAVLTGILPTLAKAHLGMENMTPLSRYYQLNRILSELRGRDFLTQIEGLETLHTTHDNVMLESCNTSFQIHFQVGPDEFARLYNLAQSVTGPVMAAAANSPVLLQHRLWHETRVALLQQSIDARSEVREARGGRARVSFGDGWVEESVLEIFREDIARFRVILATDLGESSMELLERGEVPPLNALRLHTGTVYRWNRACYGIRDGKAHLRIENRTLPSGPTVADEIGNGAFYFGLMSALGEEHGDITSALPFDDVKDNFTAAARYGLKAQFRWVGAREFTARDLILQQLLPRAREGLQGMKVDQGDIDRYLGIVEARVQSGRTGSQWALDSLAAMKDTGTKDARYRALTVAMAKNQQTGSPVHTWELAREEDAEDWRDSYRTVGQVMTSDVFTVHPEDLVDLAASMMEWEHIRHVPVEDDDARLVGIVSHRSLLRLVGRGLRSGTSRPVAVREIMKPDPVTVTPETSCLEALQAMRREQVGCLPVVEDGRLVGIVTEADFLGAVAKLFEEELGQS